MAATIHGTPRGYFNYNTATPVLVLPAGSAGHSQTVVWSIQDDYSNTTITPPVGEGWVYRGATVPGQGSAIEDTARLVLYTRLLTGSVTAGDTSTWGLGASKQIAANVWTVTEDFSTFTQTNFAGPSVTWTAPDVTCPTVAGTDALHVSVVGPAWYARTRSATPAGYTAMTTANSESDSGSYTNVISGYKAVGTGATGTTDWTVAVGGGFTALSIIYTSVASAGTITVAGGGQLSFDQPSTPATGGVSRASFQFTNVFGF